MLSPDIKWTAFANKGDIRENLKHEQIKIIKYNHLVSNLLIFYNTQEMTRVLKEFKKEGYPVKKATFRAFSPYRMEHINRFIRGVLKFNGSLTNPSDLSE